MSNISLSIYIPTYNRAWFLSYLLESIVEDLLPWPDDLEILISDNASTDNTQEVVGSFLSRGFPITSIRNDRNNGPDLNITSGFELASGKFMWVIGDDEVMYKGAIRYMLERCRNEDVGIFHLANRRFTNKQQDTLLDQFIPAIVKEKQMNSETLFRSANLLLAFISANVINRQAILEQYPHFDAKTDLNTYFAQMGWTYAALKVRNVHRYIVTPIFAAFDENSGGYKVIETFGIKLIEVTERHLNSVIPNADRKMKNAVITRFLPRQLMRQAGDHAQKNQYLDENIVEASINCFGDHMLFRIFLRPMLSHSKVKRSVAFFFVRVFNSINRWSGYRLL